MSKRQGTVSFGNAISYVIILFVFIAVCGFLAYFTNGFTDSFRGKQVAEPRN